MSVSPFSSMLKLVLYLWLRPIAQTTMAGDVCLRPYSWTLRLKLICVSDNHTLIDRLISYALYVVAAYGWNIVAFPMQ